MTHRTALRYTACTVGPLVYLSLGAIHRDPFNWNVALVAMLILIGNACWDIWRFDK